MSRPISVKLLSDGKDKVRPVKAVLMRWALTEDLSVADILDKSTTTMSLPEYAAWMLVKNVEDATPGSRQRQQALEALRVIMDGLEEGQIGPQIPVTLIDSLIETDGVYSRKKEVQTQTKVSLVLPEAEPQENTDGR